MLLSVWGVVSLCLVEMVSLLHHLVRKETKKENLNGLLGFVLAVMVLFIFVIANWSNRVKVLYT